MTNGNLGEDLDCSPPDDRPRCQTCNRPTDDIEAMDEGRLLDFLRVNALRMLAHSVKGGNLSHQELAIVRGLLRDNTVALKSLEPGDEDMPPQRRTKLPQRRRRPDFDGTAD